MENLERRIDDGEQSSRRQCLRLNNIELPQQGEKETCMEKVEKVLRDLDCGVGVESVDRAHRIGPVKVSDEGSRSQQMIVRFNSFRDRKKCTEHGKVSLVILVSKLGLI